MISNRYHLSTYEVSPTYTANSNFKFDDSTGILTFVGLRDYKFYDVEIKF